MIKIEHLRKEYESITPLEDVSVQINDGDVISVIGPSGTGKSTLLRCINLLEDPTSGHIYIDDDEITAKDCDVNRIRQKLGMVFQSFNLFDHLTVIENIMMSPVKLKGLSRQEAYDKAIELLNSPAVRNSVSPLPGLWQWIPRSSCLMSRQVHLIQPWSAKLKKSSDSWRKAARRC